MTPVPHRNGSPRTTRPEAVPEKQKRLRPRDMEDATAPNGRTDYMAETAEEILARQDAESLARVRTVAAATRQTERAVTEWERLDLLVDTDPLALRDEAWTLVNKLDAADALVRRLGKHLTALCDHPVNWEKRYRTEDGAPCTGCYDARDAYQAYIAEAGS